MSDETFVTLRNALRNLDTDPATAKDPIKRTFLCDGRHVSANVSILEDTGTPFTCSPPTTSWS